VLHFLIQTLTFDAKVKLNSKTDLGMITFCCFIVVGLEMTKKNSDECFALLVLLSLHSATSFGVDDGIVFLHALFNFVRLINSHFPYQLEEVVVIIVVGER
jgi:hypothetical protein